MFLMTPNYIFLDIHYGSLAALQCLLSLCIQMYLVKLLLDLSMYTSKKASLWWPISWVKFRTEFAVNYSSKELRIKLYYENQMNNQYKKDEKIMKDIIRKNVKPANENDKMELIIYYRNIKTKNLIMKNNIASNNNNPLSKSRSLYKFTCPHEDCELLTSSYIGMTRNTINKRLEQHCKDGAIKEHLRLKH